MHCNHGRCLHVHRPLHRFQQSNVIEHAHLHLRIRSRLSGGMVDEAVGDLPFLQQPVQRQVRLKPEVDRMVLIPQARQKMQLPLKRRRVFGEM